MDSPSQQTQHCTQITSWKLRGSSPYSMLSWNEENRMLRKGPECRTSMGAVKTTVLSTLRLLDCTSKEVSVSHVQLRQHWTLSWIFWRACVQFTVGILLWSGSNMWWNLALSLPFMTPLTWSVYNHAEGEKRVIFQGMAHWENRTCIRFRPRESSDTASVMFITGGHGV